MKLRFTSKTKYLLLSGLFLITLVLVQFWLNYNSPESKLARLVKAAPEIKNQYKLDKLSLVLPAKDQNSVQVAIGDPSAKIFTPDLTLSRWGDEVSLKILVAKTETHPVSVANAPEPPLSRGESGEISPDKGSTPPGAGGGVSGLSFDGDKIKYTTPDAEYRFYNQPNISSDGAYEFEVIYDKKPASNIVSLPIETKNLDFFYQPPLNQTKLPPDIVVSCTATDCYNKSGKVVVHTSENAVGSYAVYYKGGKSGDYTALGGKNYRTGQAFKIYRPQIIDANGNKVWGELNINKDRGNMTIAVPQDFLDKAVYPVTVDPTFGYDTAGSTGFGTGEVGDALMGIYTSTEAGVIDKLTASIFMVSGSDNGKAAIFGNSGSYVLISEAVGDAVNVSNTSPAWKDFPFSGTRPSVTASTDYWLSLVDQSGTFSVMANNLGYGDIRYHACDYTTPTDLGDAPAEVAANYNLSIYATYAAAAKPTYVPDGLVGWWTFNGEDISGTTTAVDRSGAGNSGTINGAVPVPGISGQALSFDGVDDYVNAGSASSLDDLGPLTFSVWIKPRITGSNQRIISKNGTTLILTILTGGSLDFYKDYDITGVERTTAGNTIRSGIWQHVVVTWDGSSSYSNIHIYVDNREIDLSSDTYHQNGTNVKLVDASGNLYISSSVDCFDGLIDEVRVYNRALTADEIKLLYQTDGARLKVKTSSIPGSVNPISGLLGWWKLDENPASHSTAMTDSSGQGNNGTLSTGDGATNKSVTGHIGQAINFDGTNDYVDAGASTAFNLSSSPISVSAWIRPNDFTMYNGATPRIIIKRQDANNGWMLNLDSTADTSVCSTNSVSFVMVRGGVSAPFVCYNGPSLSTGQWYYVVGVSDGTNLSIYINGAVASVATRSVDYGLGSSNNLFFGWRSDALGFYNGSLDDVRVYNRALSAGEIQQLYNYSGAHADASLVGGWTFNGPDMEWLTNTAYDISGSGNNGTMINMSATTSTAVGQVGQALKFDGTASEVFLATSSISNFANPASVCAWVNTKDIGADQTIITNFFDGNNTFVLMMLGGQICFSYQKGGSYSDACSGVVISNNIWAHVCGIWDGASVSLYKNGEALSSGYWSGSDTDGNYIGVRNFFQDRMMYGLLDEVRVYNRALSPSEITQLYNLGTARTKFNTSGTPRSINPTIDLMGWWKLDENPAEDSIIIADASGQGYNGTLITGDGSTNKSTAGQIGQAINFDGVDDCLNVSSFSSTNKTYSFSLWMKDNFESAGNLGLVWLFDSQSGRLGLYYTGNGTHNIGFYDGSFHDITTPPNDHKWHHIVFVLNNSTTLGSYYLDGNFVGSGAYTGLDIGGVTAIGQAYYCTYGAGNYNLFNGSIDDFRIYNRALTQSEITQLYNYQGIQDASLLGYWTFDGPDVSNSANLVYDRSGQGNNGTMVNMAKTTRYAVGISGQALSLDGVDDYVETAANDFLDSDQAGALSVWIKTDNASTSDGGGPVIASYSNDNVAHTAVGGWGLDSYKTGRPEWSYKVDAGGNWACMDGTTYVADNNWHHIVFSADGTNPVQIYVDGVSNSVTYSDCLSGAFGGTDSDWTADIYGVTSYDNYLDIGGQRRDSGVENKFPGLIDEVRVYNRALTATEVLQLYRAGARKVALGKATGPGAGTCSASTDYIGWKGETPSGTQQNTADQYVTGWLYSPTCSSGCSSGKAINAYAWTGYAQGSIKVCIYSADGSTSELNYSGNVKLSCSGAISPSSAGWFNAAMDTAATLDTSKSYWIVEFSNATVNGGDFYSVYFAGHTAHYCIDATGYYASPPANLGGLTTCYTPSADWQEPFYVTVGPSGQ